MTIEIVINLRCSAHPDIEIMGDIDLKKGIGYVESCPLCLKENNDKQFKAITDKLLEFKGSLKIEDVKVIPHVRKKPKGKELPMHSLNGFRLGYAAAAAAAEITSEKIVYHCTDCGIELDPAITCRDLEGRVFCTPCAVKNKED